MIRHTEVDGVPTLIAPTSGPLHAGLMFRVGRADETLPRAGLTHLLEHLTLHPLGLADYHYNGATGPVMTYFHMQGPEQEVAGFLTGVCAALSDLPMHRLQIEKDILRTEYAGRTPHLTEPMALWRYGARDHGLTGYPEWGLPMITPDDLHAWAARFFTRDNAVLWIGGRDVPAGLKLNLPAGERRAVPAPSSALPVTPAYFSGDSPAVALDAVVRRRTAASVFTGVLDRELFRGLRQEGGYSYTAGADYNPRGDGYAVVTALADALPEKQDAVLGEFVDILATLRAGRIRAADVEAVVAKRTDALTNAEVSAARLPTVAFGLLTGERLRSAEELTADLAAVTVADVHEVAVEALASALLMTPNGRPADWAGFAEAPTRSAAVPAGSSYRSLDGDDVHLVAGPEGVGLVGEDSAVAVRYDECVAVLGWPDGRRLLVGADAITVPVEPTMFAGGAAVPAAVDAAVPAHLRVTMPARDPATIPKPDPKRKRKPKRKTVAGSRRRLLKDAGIPGLVLLTLLFGGLTLCLGTTLVLDDTGTGTKERVVAVVGLVISVFLARTLFHRIKQVRHLLR